MKTTFAIIAGLATAISAQGVTSVITPTASAPSGCATNFSGDFQISVVNVSSVTTKREEVVKRASCPANTLAITLNNSVLLDQSGRTGYIAANRQFQFDGPAQTGAIYTGGFSVCSNGSLALGGSAVFYQCLSGTFYNLYDQSQGPQCSQILIQAGACSGSASSSAFSGQPSASSAGVSQIGDGQPQASTSATLSTAKVSQISDGQVQASTSATLSTAKISQISDGQIQATTAATVSPISSAKISQISDGQIQATTAASVSPSSVLSSAVISQISDGQIQATTAPVVPSTTLSSAVISQISDGQIQASTAASNATSPAQFTGAAAANTVGGGLAAVVLGVVAAIL